MLLTVDVGNTNIVLGLFDGDHLFESYRIKTDPRVTADELALMFRGLLSAQPAPDGVAVCSTVPSVLEELRRMFQRYFSDVPTVVVGPGVKTGVPLLYDNPREVGPDRVVNTLAAHTSTAARRSSSTSARRPTSTSWSAKGEFPRRRARAGDRDLGRRARRPCRRGCSRSSSWSRARSSARRRRRRSSRAALRLRRAGGRHGPAASRSELGEAGGARPPVACRTSW
jgi:hypothetical protein